MIREPKISKNMMTAIERALCAAGVVPSYIKMTIVGKRKVSCQPVFINGEKEYAVYVSDNPNHILGLFKSIKVMRAFIKHFQLDTDYDGVF